MDYRGTVGVVVRIVARAVAQIDLAAELKHSP